MITSIFSKSKPINLIIVVVLVVLSLGFYAFPGFSKAEFSILNIIIGLLIVVFYVFITEFLISKNKLTKRNSYCILVLGLSVLIFPEIFNTSNLLIANVMVLLALRRLFSLHTKRSLSKKFFDAVFWIAMASLFYTWALLFLIVIVIALGHYWQNEGKYIAVSLFALLSVFVLLVLFNIIFKDQYLPESNFDFSFSLNFFSYNSPYKIIRFTIVIAVYIWSLVFYSKQISEKNKALKTIHSLIVITSIVALVIAFIAPLKTGNEVVFFLVPLSIIVANYIETITENWFKESFVGLLLIIPILSLLL